MINSYRHHFTSMGFKLLSCSKFLNSRAFTAGVSPRLEDDGSTLRRRRVLTRVDRELEKRNYKEALSLIKQLQHQPGGLRGFGAIKLVPNKILELNELQNSEFSSVSSSGQQSLIDTVMHSIECCRQFAVEEQEVRYAASTRMFIESQTIGLVDNESDNSASEDRFMCLQHEAGHFLVGYLLGLLPKRYSIPRMHDLMENRYAGGKVEFLGFEFLSEVDVADTLDKKRKKTEGVLSNETLNRFLCVILAGLVAEHLVFGYSELLHSDVKKMDNVLKWLNFTKDEACFRVRYAALNSIIMLNIHDDARSKLAEAMASQKSIAFCIHTIENSL